MHDSPVLLRVDELRYGCLGERARRFTGLVELDSGAIWASSEQRGVLPYRDEVREAAPAGEALVSRVGAMTPSPSGGVWLVGEGVFRRVEESTESSEGWLRLRARVSNPPRSGAMTGGRG